MTELVQGFQTETDPRAHPEGTDAELVTYLDNLPYSELLRHLHDYGGCLDGITDAPCTSPYEEGEATVAVSRDTNDAGFPRTRLVFRYPHGQHEDHLDITERTLVANLQRGLLREANAKRHFGTGERWAPLPKHHQLMGVALVSLVEAQEATEGSERA